MKFLNMNKKVLIFVELIYLKNDNSLPVCAYLLPHKF